jgi:hypothetical protein
MSEEGSSKEENVNIFLGIFAVVVGAVFLAIVIMVMIGGFTSHEEYDSYPGGGLSIKGYIDPREDAIIIEQISGETDWEGLEVRVYYNSSSYGLEFNTGPVVTRPGDIAYFTSSELDIVAGNEYNVKIIHIGRNAVLWEDDIFAYDHDSRQR